MVAIYSAFINSAGVEPLLGTIPAIIAKSSMLWTSLIYIFSNKNIRSKIFMCFKMDKIQNNKLSKSRGILIFAFFLKSFRILFFNFGFKFGRKISWYWKTA